jgi:hypothetical protein
LSPRDDVRYLIPARVKNVDREAKHRTMALSRELSLLQCRDFRPG